MDLITNEPKLADVRAPWENVPSGWQRLKPRNLWKAIVYNSRYKGFWAPASMDSWRYRRLLSDLDDVCLRCLSSFGALTSRQLADCLNQNKRFHTKPELTGIQRISVATAHDWVNLARRRGYVAAWHGEAEGAQRTGHHWELTERGEQAIHSRPMAFLSRLPYGSLLTVLITGGGLVAVLNWLGRHPTAIILAIYILLLVLWIGGLVLWASRSEKREKPAIAVVAIETQRSSGKPFPAL